MLFITKMDDMSEYNDDALSKIMSLGLNCHNHLLNYLNDILSDDGSLNMFDISKKLQNQECKIRELERQLREKDMDFERKIRERDKQDEFNREKLMMEFERKLRNQEMKLMNEIREKDVELAELRERIIQNQQITMKIMMRTQTSSSISSFSSKEKRRHHSSRRHRSHGEDSETAKEE